MRCKRVRVRHGLVLSQVFAEIGERKHDLIVTGSSPTRGPLGHYIMGDLTRSILNRSECPVLVARSGPAGAPRSIFQSLKNVFVKSGG